MFAAKTAGAEDGVDVFTLDEERVELLRQVFWDVCEITTATQNVDVPDSDPDGLHLPDDIRLGMLMLISHFYENRSSVTEVEKLDMPQSFGWLVGPYRYFPQ